MGVDTLHGRIEGIDESTGAELPDESAQIPLPGALDRKVSFRYRKTDQ